MILHIFSADNFFLSAAIKTFNNAGLHSEFILIQTKNVKSHVNHEVNTLTFNSKEYRHFISNLQKSKYTLVLFHGLLTTNELIANDILKLKNVGIKTSWVIYGSEIQIITPFIDNMHGEITKKIYFRLNPLRRLLPILKFIKKITNTSLYNIISQIDFVVHFMPHEIEYVETTLNLQKKHLWFTYVTLEDYLANKLMHQKVQNTKNILLGNSSSFTSNHAEIIELFSKKLNKNYQYNLITPLSYGNKNYAKYITKFGKEKLGNNFTPILDYMPLEEYNKVLLSCPIVIMNHFRQQALGNIIVALWLGAKVFLNENISTYNFFKQIGIKIFSIQSLKNTDLELCFEMLSDEDTNKNREILKAFFGKENVTQKVKDSFQQFNIGSNYK